MEYYYQVPWLARSPRPGRHRSAQVGSGMLANRSVPLHSGADLRRLDIHARIADPMKHWWVRETLQRDAINVWLVADVSASMSFISNSEKDTQLTLLRDFAVATAQSSFRSGDAFGFIAADDAVRSDLHIALTRRAGAREAVREAFAAPQIIKPRAGVNALQQCAEQMSARKSLVFLVSDFLLDMQVLERTLISLTHHHVVPVVLPAAHSLEHLPKYAWLTLNDLETGRERSVLMRPTLKAKLQQAAQNHEAALSKAFIKHGLKPLKLTAPFDTDEVTDYFYEP